MDSRTDLSNPNLIQVMKNFDTQTRTVQLSTRVIQISKNDHKPSSASLPPVFAFSLPSGNNQDDTNSQSWPTIPGSTLLLYQATWYLCFGLQGNELYFSPPRPIKINYSEVWGFARWIFPNHSVVGTKISMNIFLIFQPGNDVSKSLL